MKNKSYFNTRTPHPFIELGGGTPLPLSPVRLNNGTKVHTETFTRFIPT